ncbi:MAG TPA: hypothetical protein PKN80_01780 [bacterium]|nr:hypothetical protein [bacterium]HNS49092.1 hypothetical protein [bacterium]
MELEYKNDWPETAERYRAWWAGEYFGRCGLWVTGLREGVPEEAPPAPPARSGARFLSFDYLAAANEHAHRRTFYGAEAFPGWHPGYPGWNCAAAFLGCPVRLDDHTGWLDPIVPAGPLTDFDFRKLTLDEGNRWWQLHLEMLRFEARQAAGRSIPSLGAFGASGDTLAALRGSSPLLYDLVDCPEYVAAFETHLMDVWIEIYRRSQAVLAPAAEGTTCWFTLWAPGKFYSIQNDFAYMISPAMFRKVFLPEIERQTRFLDHALYHLDGVGNFNHLEALLELPRLRAVQVLPGAGKPGPLHYLEVLRRVQSAGLNLHISIPAAEVPEALERLSARGLFIATSCRSEAEARHLIRECEERSVPRRF